MQLVQLQQAQKRFREHGIGLVGVSYDSQAILKDFSTRQGITFPLLADPQSELIQRFGVLNTTATGFTKGMAFPGFIYIGPDGKIRETFFEKQYAARFTANNIMSKLFPELAGSDVRTVPAPHLVWGMSQSDVVVGPGSRVTLTVELTLPPEIHVYAPGAKGYKAVELQIDPNPDVSMRPVQFPASKVLFLPAIHEQVPVFEGKFKISQDVVVSYSETFIRVLGSGREGKTIAVRGTLLYQACDEKICYPPEKAVVSWELQVQPLDRTRVPKRIQHDEKPSL